MRILLGKMTKNSIMESALNFTAFCLMKTCGVVFSFVCFFFFFSITAKAVSEAPDNWYLLLLLDT